MILDRGICTICHTIDTAAPGEAPSLENRPFWESWYGELSFETAPARPTDSREDLRTDARIRVLQNRAITTRDVVTLTAVDGTATTYRVRRAYHGTDTESGEPISDLSLEVIDP